MHGRPPILPAGVENICAEEARARLESGEAKVLDVREPSEHINAHIPGSVLIPLASLASRFEELDPDAAWIVHCEHGIRSLQAAAFLSTRGFRSLANLDGGLVQWRGPTADHRALFSDPSRLQPNGWILEQICHAPPGRALDVACGHGRNALAVAYHGWSVTGVDADAERIAAFERYGRALNFPVSGLVCDLEEPGAELPGPAWELVIVVHYLHRALLPALRDAVRPGGLLVYETFTREHAARGRPTNPDYLLERGELQEWFRDWEILASREGEAGPDAGHDRRNVSSIAARRPGGSSA